MNRTLSILATAGAALVLAAPASTHTNGPVVTIRHQTHGCHAWAVAGGKYKASIAVKLARGVHLEIANIDVMPHKLVQIAGPRVKLPNGAAMNTMSAMIEVRFPKAGVYKFTTKAGEDYMKGVKTIGEDNVLKLKVTVT